MKIPSSAHKRYLGGADWCIAALSHGTAETTGRRCVFHIAVFLSACLDATQAETQFRAYCSRFPALWGSIRRCWCLAPYWKHEHASSDDVSITGSEQPGNTPTETVIREIEGLVNTQSALSACRVALHTIRLGGQKDVLVFAFDHALFDAAGAESFIRLFFRFLNGDPCDADFPAPHLTASAQLDHWGRRFMSGRKINRLMQRLSEGDTAWLPIPQDAPARPFRFRARSLSQEESRQIKDRAFKVAGYLMFTPYVLASVASVFRPLFAKTVGEDSHFVVSVSTDKPQTAAGRAPHLFFNDLSFLYFRFPLKKAADRNALAAEVRDQFISQVKDEAPAAIEDANLLMRILSPGAFWKFLMRFCRKRLASFGFTCLGETALTSTAVLGLDIEKHIHFPVIPTPPGIGLVLNQSGGAYQMILSYIEGIIPEEAADRLLETLRLLLLNEADTRHPSESDTRSLPHAGGL